MHDRVRRKVDHPRTGSKDVSDSLCGAVQNVLLSTYADTDIHDGIADFLFVNDPLRMLHTHSAKDGVVQNISMETLIEEEIDRELSAFDFL